MRFKTEEKEAIGRCSNRVLKEVLEREREGFLDTLKVSEDISKLRFTQGSLNALDEILKVIK